MFHGQFSILTVNEFPLHVNSGKVSFPLWFSLYSLLRDLVMLLKFFSKSGMVTAHTSRINSLC